MVEYGTIRGRPHGTNINLKEYVPGHYDDVQSLGIKYDLVNSFNFAGIEYGNWNMVLANLNYGSYPG